jgi:mono/diheme cytochrome c family protein
MHSCTSQHWLLLAVLTAVGLVCAGCHRDMRDQPRYEALETSDFFPDRMIARPAVAGTVARGQLHEDTAFATGKENGQFVSEIPLEIDKTLLLRGQDRYQIHCSMCHGYGGLGDGMVVQRGFNRPPSFHLDRVKDAPSGHYFDVITNGLGFMPRYGPRIPARDRWAIVAYVRVLQISHSATLDDVPEAERRRLREETP